MRDDRSDYKWLFAFPDKPAENAARGIIDCAAAFGVSNGLMFDSPNHFKNETVRLVPKRLNVPFDFIFPYSPWIDGSVERLGKELLRTFRSIKFKLQMHPDK